MTGRVAIAVMAAGGLSVSLFVVGPAVAATRDATTHVVVSTVKSTKLGTILVSGNTVYTLNKVGKAVCASACLKIWPVVLLPKGVTKATAGAGVSSAKLGTVARAGGVLQVTYAGKPLYFFSGDKAAGQVKGNVTDTWGTWSDVTIKPAAPGGGRTAGSGDTAATSPTTAAPTTPTSPTMTDGGSGTTPTTTATSGSSPTTTSTTVPDKSPTTTATVPNSGGVGS